MTSTPIPAVVEAPRPSRLPTEGAVSPGPARSAIETARSLS
ncbi:hypothetical protein [Streptomyces sp. NPDC048639]